jgi:hypothetical protein
MQVATREGGGDLRNREREASVRDRDEEAPFEGGSQPVREHPPEMPTGGRSVMQTVVVVIAVLVVVAALLWLLVPFGG